MGRYALERELGRGGMATVYLAWDLRHKRRVAIKVVRPELAAVLGPERFLREIEITAQLNHPHILPLLDSGDAGGFLYYAMPYAEGESLRGRLNREKQLPIEDAIAIAREVADALDYAHRHGVVHRDIKPENVLLQERHAVVADFGIARAISLAGGEKLTATGVAVGTPEYMSPEQASGRGELDGRSDIYALGCVLHEMLAGQPPFTGATAEAVLRQHLTVNPPAMSGIRAGVPARMARAVERCLAKSAADRFATAAELARELAGSGQGGTTAGGPVRLTRRLALGVLAAAVLATAWWALRGAHVPARGPEFPRTAVAVLPFQNLSADAPGTTFAGGLHEELLTQLAHVAALKVISRTSVMGYAGTTKPLKEIARELGVGSIVEGSVQVEGARLRVNVQLIDATTDEHRWAERYDRTLDDAFAIQSDVAQQIVAAVGATLSDPERHRLAAAPTENAEAYRFYLQGRGYHNRATVARQNLEFAEQLYERALALDPDFALAHAALSHVHGAMYWYKYDPSPARATRQREEAETALRLAADLPEAHVAMGLAHYWGRRDYRRALEEFAIALKALPNDDGLWARIGYVHRRLGNWDEALKAQARAAELNPRAANTISELGSTYRAMHRYADAVRAYDRALSLAPDLQIAAVERGETYLAWQGQLDTLRAVASRSPPEAALEGFGFGEGPLQPTLLYWERQADSLLLLRPTTGLAVFQGLGFFLPQSLYAAWAHQLRGDRQAALAAFDSARVLLDSVVRGELADDWRVHAALGLALAGLGRRKEALREARWLQRSVDYTSDASGGPGVAVARARILVQAGEPTAALNEIERVLAGYSSVSVHTLRLDPLWDPIRKDSRFQALLAKYDKR